MDKYKYIILDTRDAQLRILGKLSDKEIIESNTPYNLYNTYREAYRRATKYVDCSDCITEVKIIGKKRRNKKEK